MANRPHDALFKAAFSAPTHAAGLLRSIFPPAISAEIDWSSLRRQPGSFVDAELADRHTDLLFAAKTRGEDVLLYVLVEHQSGVDPDMPLRMLGYEVRIWEAHRARVPRGDLPSILPVVLCHAPGGWTATRRFESSFAAVVMARPAIAELVPKFSLVIEDLSHRTNAELKAMSLAVFQRLALWLLRDARDGERFRAELPAWSEDLAAAHRAAQRSSDGMQAFARLIRYVWQIDSGLRFEDFRARMLEELPDSGGTIMTIEEELINKGIERGREQGREQGLREGLLQGRVSMLRRLLAQRFGPLDPELDAQIAAASPEALDRYLDRLLTATTAREVFAAHDGDGGRA